MGKANVIIYNIDVWQIIILQTIYTLIYLNAGNLCYMYHMLYGALINHLDLVC